MATDDELQVTRCTNCGHTDLDPAGIKEVVRTLGGVRMSVEVPAQTCRNCGERFIRAADLGAAEGAITYALVARGIGGADVARWLRKGAELRVDELAVLLGVTAEAVSRWEQAPGPDRATIAVLGDLAVDALNGRTTARDRLQAAANPPTSELHLRAHDVPRERAA